MIDSRSQRGRWVKHRYQTSVVALSKGGSGWPAQIMTDLTQTGTHQRCITTSLSRQSRQLLAQLTRLQLRTQLDGTGPVCTS